MHDIAARQHVETLNHLRTLSRSALLAYAMDVAQYLVDQYFDGDIANYFDRSRYKQSSFAGLLENHAEELAELGLSGTTLRNYIAVWDVYANLNDGVRGQLGLTPLMRLSVVKDKAARNDLAQEAAENNWKLRDVETAVSGWQARQRKGAKRGRKALAPLVKEVGGLRRQTEKWATSATLDATMTADERDKLIQDLDQVLLSVTRLRAALREPAPAA